MFVIRYTDWMLGVFVVEFFVFGLCGKKYWRLHCIHLHFILERKYKELVNS
jgi:hypothetical protein